MPNKKQLIQILVIVLAFLAAGYVLYSGGLFGGAKPGSGPAGPAGAPAAVSGEILPYGNLLADPKDFNKVIDHSRFQYDLVQYPKLDSQKEVGIPEDSIVSPPATK